MIALSGPEVLEYIEDKGNLDAEVVRLGQPLTSTCLYGFYEETIKENLRPLFETKGLLYYARVLLDNDL